MLRPILFLVLSLLAGGALIHPNVLLAQTVETATLAQTVETATVSGGAEELGYLDRLPPLIDREIFFGNPEISGGQLSPDGRWVSFVKPLDGIRNIWVKAIAEPFEAARPMTADSLRPVQGYFGAGTPR